MSRKGSTRICSDGILVVSVLFLLSSASGQNSDSNKHNGGNNHINFQPSKDFPLDSNGTQGISTRYFQNPSTHQFYNPHSPSFNKFHNYFYPSHPVSTFHSGYGANSHYGRHIRVPGRIEIRIEGGDAQITCEFQRYLILVQGIYWHHNVEPFGSYFDTRNNFAPHITVTNIDLWKSVLTIKNFSPDDFGNYRCISTALLPDESRYPNHGYASSEIRSNSVEVPKRKVRFARQIKDQTNLNTVYDPFYTNFLNLGFNTNPQSFVPQPPNHQTYVPNINPTSNFYNPGYSPNQNYPHAFSPTTGFYDKHDPFYYRPWNFHAPYYNPSYAYSTVYQEINFNGTTNIPGK